MASLLRLQALFSLRLATPRRLPSHLRCAAAVASPLPRRLPAAASNGSPEQRASETDLESGLYLVATPIGNLEDITLRYIIYLAVIWYLSVPGEQTSDIFLFASNIYEV
ncbi:hypothetical protein TRIUR3_28717 [Triticum urartu]|uniref:Uncharacterized protein n=1 Tax=Triticum urartu TaxID=4572 RepID=M7ZP52_TRIUA|nr:hypothetical protein TRIUR3_28717 [Triticum urartu]